jgi:hypothetical protein
MANVRRRFDTDQVERWLVHLVALHSLAVGAMLLLAPGWATTFGGWSSVAPLFFPRQAGVFHFVVVVGYLGEYWRYGGVRLLVATKAIAVAFLVTLWLLGETAWSVPFSALGDAAMGLAVALAHRARTTASAPAAASTPRRS